MVVCEFSTGAGGAIDLEPGTSVQWDCWAGVNCTWCNRRYRGPALIQRGRQKPAPLASYASNLERLANLAGF